jgi:hypothetical protein
MKIFILLAVVERDSESTKFVNRHVERVKYTINVH